MKWLWRRLVLAAAWAAASAVLAGGAMAQTSSTAACPAPAEVTHLHLYGLWRAEFTGQAQGATLLFEKHPDYPESVRGGINRNGVRGMVAGDVEDGEFNLDESDDGTSIAAAWTGTVVENSCGKEIRGTWTPASGKPVLGFVLRKVPGWQ